MPVITIRGQLGSGAPEIGKLVAQRLHLDYVDREIIAGVADRLNTPEKKIEAKEMPAGTLAGRISEALNHSYPPVSGSEGLSVPIPYLPAWEIPLDDPSYLTVLSSIIKDLAGNQSIVIRGRGSQFILRGFPNTYHILVVAPLKTRIERVMAERRMNEKTAKKEIHRFDTSRREFVKRYFKADLEDPVNYDLVVNTEHLTYEDAAETVIDALSLREKAAG